jgi:hypothetical protein
MNTCVPKSDVAEYPDDLSFRSVAGRPLVGCRGSIADSIATKRWVRAGSSSPPIAQVYRHMRHPDGPPPFPQLSGRSRTRPGASCAPFTRAMNSDALTHLIGLLPAIGLAIGLGYFATRQELKRRHDRRLRHLRRMEEERRVHSQHAHAHHHGDDAHDHEH